MNDPKQKKMELTDTTPVESVEEYRFDNTPPINGFPELRWRGKRPFLFTRYYPAQIKEIHGAEINGWRNKIYWGDNLQVMSHLIKNFRGQVKLAYIDPPFDSKADYKKNVGLNSSSTNNDYSAFEEKQYTDIWSNDEYLQFIYERLILIKELLAEDGAIYVHLNHARVHLVRSILDEIFGSSNFKNDIIWKNAPAKSHPQYFGRIKDTILFYVKSPTYIWNKQFGVISEEYKASFNKKDERGFYVTQPLHSGHPAKIVPKWRGVKPPEGRGWAYKVETLDQFEAEGKIEWSEDGVPRLKRYLEEVEGAVIQDVWDDIPPVLPKSNAFLDYPTQKPEALLERIIRASSNYGDLIFDGFMGSGTTQVVAMKLGRRFLGADINLGAVQVTTKRLLEKTEDMKGEGQQSELFSGHDQSTPDIFYTGFEVYNVNHYDVFRNPVEARELLLEALEVNKLTQGQLFDGEKDGRMVKIMPVNRIASRADLGELIAGLDLKAFAKRQKANPNDPVEKITLICMGHEPDLKAHLIKEADPYKLDVEVVDILRDRQDLQFKRDSEAKVVIKSGKLVIERFYPMNLLGKLSLQKEKVKDWKELVESVMIDWNYDGAVLTPTTVDIPEKDELVSGAYPIPKDAGTIRVKITDLLSESLEVEVTNA